MILRQFKKKWIAMMVVLAFCYLLNLNAFPLQGQDKPGALETPGTAGYYGGGSSMVPILLVALAVAALAVVLVLVILKNLYDITGDWGMLVSYNDGYTWGTVVTFTGDTLSGSTYEDSDYGTGTYSVDSKNVVFTLRWSNGNSGTYNGIFTDKNTISGTFDETSGYYGNFDMIRGTSIPTKAGKLVHVTKTVPAGAKKNGQKN
jgi:hypothetical protein